ncbi:hypothetical protein BDQ17DRAFT_695782 [Cyathus striatus]|nr:hypothetical protein BDQ17DRAFT_695782 [Cyathus striatus]
MWGVVISTITWHVVAIAITWCQMWTHRYTIPPSIATQWWRRIAIMIPTSSTISSQEEVPGFSFSSQSCCWIGIRNPCHKYPILSRSPTSPIELIISSRLCTNWDTERFPCAKPSSFIR